MRNARHRRRAAGGRFLAAAVCGLAVAALGLPAGCSSGSEWRAARASLMTRWAADVSPTNARPEYPRPMMRRDAWMNLNGLWDYAVTPRDVRPERFAGRILVPYPIESALSGVMDTVGPTRTLWYRRAFEVPAAWRSGNGATAGRVLLHFEAADWQTDVWVNGQHLGTHRGGFDPFTFDVTTALRASGAQELVVSIWDPTDSGTQARGKQVRRPGGIFYTSVTGIWQTVWLEPVAATAIRDYGVETDIAAGLVRISVESDGLREGDLVQAVLRAPPDSAPAAPPVEVASASGTPDRPLAVRIPRPHLWSPDDPFLYDLELRLVRAGQGGAGADPPTPELLDRVTGTVGLRSIAVGQDERGVTRLLLNGRFVFQNGPLDQGYWPDGLYTAPTEAAMVSDLRVLKAMGFNMLRKHVKVEPRTFYAWCDRLGLLVWQDMPSASIPLAGPASDSATETAATRQFETELTAMVRTHRSHPSIVMWVPFNEGWGQYDTERIVRLVRAADPTRLVNHASGWHERRAGDVVDGHSYPAPDPPRPERRRAAVLGEYGGLGLVVRGHTWKPGGWGYDLFGTREALAQRYEDFAEVVRLAARDRGLSAAVYTQTSDVETENNGLLTYDRAEAKIPPETVWLANRGYYAPRVSRTAPIFVDSVLVGLHSSTPGAVIRFTTDGTVPRRSSQAYERPFYLNRTTTVRTRAYWPDGAWSRVTSFGVAQVEPRASVRLEASRPGLLASVFEQDGSWRRLPAFDSLRPARTSIALRIGLAPAGPLRENYGLRYRGYIRIPATGVYGFHLASDDGSRLLIDGRPVVENDGIHGLTERSGWVALAEGLHPFELTYFQGCCGIGLQLAVDGPGRARGEVPPGWLFHVDERRADARRRARENGGPGTSRPL